MRRPEDVEAMRRCGETCPAVDGAFADLLSELSDIVPSALSTDAERLVEKCCEAVKEKGTLILRAALVDACDDLLTSRNNEEAAEARIRDLELVVDDLSGQIRRLEAELAEVTA